MENDVAADTAADAATGDTGAAQGRGRGRVVSLCWPAQLDAQRGVHAGLCAVVPPDAVRGDHQHHQVKIVIGGGVGVDAGAGAYSGFVRPVVDACGACACEAGDQERRASEGDWEAVGRDEEPRAEGCSDERGRDGYGLGDSA